MSYRTYVNGTQIFGNNESYQEWIDFIRSEGIEVDEEYNYKGEIKNFMEALLTIEKISMNIERKRYEQKKELVDKLLKNGMSNEEINNKIGNNDFFGFSSIFDLSSIYNKVVNSNQNKDDNFGYSLFDELDSIIENGYMFLPYSFYLACKDKLESSESFLIKKHFKCYRVKFGETIEVEGR